MPEVIICDNAVVDIHMDEMTADFIEGYGIYSENFLVENNVKLNISYNKMTALYALVNGVMLGNSTLNFGNNVEVSVDMGSITGIENTSTQIMGIVSSGTVQIGDNCKFIINGCDAAQSNANDVMENYGYTCRKNVIGNNTTIDVTAGTNGQMACVVEEITLGKGSVIRCYSDNIGFICTLETGLSYPVYGGSKKQDVNKLAFAEYKYRGEMPCSTVMNGNVPAKYVEIGDLILVKLAANGGSVNKSGFTVCNGLAVGTLPTPTRTGYTFTGWYTATTGGTKVYSTTKLSKSTTLYAQWKKTTYNITLNANGGSVGTTKLVVEYGKTLGTMPTPTRTGYTFTGWYTAATGGTKVYSTTKPTKSMTLYAQWKIKIYTINFDGNGGTVGVEKKWVDHGNAMNFMPTPKRDGYTFTGWYTAKTGGSKVYSTTKVTKNMTLYAQWKKNSCTITFNANGGKVSTASKTVNGGTAIGTMPTPTRSGYTFTGWFTAKTGGTKVYSTTKVTNNMTLYAQWKK